MKSLINKNKQINISNPIKTFLSFSKGSIKKRKGEEVTPIELSNFQFTYIDDYNTLGNYDQGTYSNAFYGTKNVSITIRSEKDKNLKKVYSDYKQAKEENALSFTKNIIGLFGGEIVAFSLNGNVLSSFFTFSKTAESNTFKISGLAFKVNETKAGKRPEKALVKINRSDSYFSIVTLVEYLNACKGDASLIAEQMNNTGDYSHDFTEDEILNAIENAKDNSLLIVYPIFESIEDDDEHIKVTLDLFRDMKVENWMIEKVSGYSQSKNGGQNKPDNVSKEEVKEEVNEDLPID